MKRPLPKPRRRLRSELLSLMPILALSLALALLFPYKAIGFREAAPHPRTSPSCKVVELGEGVEERALDLVRAAFAVKSDRFQSMGEDLLLALLPEEALAPILSPSDRPPLAPPAAIPHEVIPMPPSLAADDPEPIPEDGPSRPAVATFPREELLKMNELN